MIGVVAATADMRVVREFFELFKTPWEVYQSGRVYDVLLCAGDANVPHRAAKIVVVYSGRRAPCDCARQVNSLPQQNNGRMLSYANASIPVYRECAGFPGTSPGLLSDQESGKATSYTEISGGTVITRIGYDLFAEVRFLLTQGQPAPNARLPALELHIAILRKVIIGNGITLIEIPPVPAGHQFIACLTHDVDHPSVRLHRFDHTSLGFLYRAIFSSIVDVARGRASVRHLLANWGAALKLPLVYLGWARDFWKDFENYPALEAGLPSTFFVIPLRGTPGRNMRTNTGTGTAPRERASAYGAPDIRDSIDILKAAGCEIALHGIDAWCEEANARQEMQVLRCVAGQKAVGVRMHWLYCDQQTPAILDRAGADYDSTAGYNEAIGYRAGTAQAYQPLDAGRLLELPLIIMDTALFLPRRQHLSAEEARSQVEAILDNAAAFGGCITVNWHDRSLSPERNWGEFYTQLLDELRRRGAWFATASDVAAWFRKRRAVTFSAEAASTGAGEDDDTPGLQIRVRSGADAAQTCGFEPTGSTAEYSTAGQWSL